MIGRLLFLILGRFDWFRDIRWKFGFKKFVTKIENNHGINFKVTKVWLDESQNECDMCGACELSAPEVFQVPLKLVINQNLDLDKSRDRILEGVYVCPVGVIAVEINNKEQINWA